MENPSRRPVDDLRLYLPSSPSEFIVTVTVSSTVQAERAEGGKPRDSEMESPNRHPVCVVDLHMCLPSPVFRVHGSSTIQAERAERGKPRDSEMESPNRHPVRVVDFRMCWPPPVFTVPVSSTIQAHDNISGMPPDDVVEIAYNVSRDLEIKDWNSVGAPGRDEDDRPSQNILNFGNFIYNGGSFAGNSTGSINGNNNQ
ncbi:uncharacterized protein LOC114733434 [Neltuma alba]|uniref:uncharacterized protein LOC114733405 n=1 Tax=Neltuma alba TaxID=207710 RepID=UPI0010A4BF37|nr:uncharacterized protein LOC114733405 [Prosopis alba]XP_028776734.1 uncharacterized protein LOC114733434 [Prosopis alba]